LRRQVVTRAQPACFKTQEILLHALVAVDAKMQQLRSPTLARRKRTGPWCAPTTRWFWLHTRCDEGLSQLRDVLQGLP